MKKVLAIVAIAAFAACNSGETKPETVDSTKIKDSLAKIAADTVKVTVDTTKAPVDTTKK